MILLKVNTRRHRAGDLVAVADLGEAFAAQLVAGGQAETVTGPEGAATAVALRRAIADLLAGLQRQADALAAQLPTIADADLVGFLELQVMTGPSAEAFDLIQAVEEALDAHRAAEGGEQDRGGVAQPNPPPNDSGDGKGEASAGPSDGTPSTGDDAASQAVNPAADEAAAGDGATTAPADAAPDDKPPSDAGSSGAAGGASVPPAEPAPAPIMPTGDPAGAAPAAKPPKAPKPLKAAKATAEG